MKLSMLLAPLALIPSIYAVKNDLRHVSVVITAIDVAIPNYNIALSAMNELTNNQAVQFGIVPVTAAQVPASACGL
ncbi:hypothetical protein NLJ89_g2517 [Agrocybe chaxingu]|uniref:Uncharacterized protein n=1 Tax=Agrocybe chaxingu TaxID=84603 RepID=A0A9W8K6F1_9AGAR|nr:hypothetical protein NLJ89_g2517 [Agrocybe chaxingu]